MKHVIKILLIGISGMMLLGCGSSKSDSKSNLTQSEPLNSNDSNSTPSEPSNSNGSNSTPSEPSNSNDSNSTPSEPSNSNDSDSTPAEPRIQKFNDFYGNWIYIDSGESEKIDSNSSFKIKSLGQNFIEITKEDGLEYMLLRDGTPDGVVRGRLYSDIEYVQKIDRDTQEKKRVPKMLLKTKNDQKYVVILDDGFHKQIKTVSINGEFNFSGVTIGKARVTILKSGTNIIDIEEVINEEENETITQEEHQQNVEEIVEEIHNNQNEDEVIFDNELPVESTDTNLGNFHVPDKKDKYNFKISKVIEKQDNDNRYMYEGRTYKIKLGFKNIFGEFAPGLNYEITSSDPYIENVTYDVVMGSLDVNQTAEIPIEVTFGRLDKIAHRSKLDLLIRDANGKEWLDYVYLDVYQTPIDVNLKTKTSNLKGYFITPEHEIIGIDTKDIKVKIPSRPDAFYYFLVVSPLSIGTETAYSLGIDVNTTEFEDFHDTSAFEPNNLEEQATKLKVGDSIKSFIHKSDIDFFTIDFQEQLSYEPPRLPFH